MSSAGYKFQWPDYLVFALSCALTVVVGVVFAVRDRWASQNSESYLMGDRQMSWAMVGVSSFASVVSAVLFVGPAAEFYYMGLEMAWMVAGLALGYLYAMFVTVPKFFRLGFKITSAYEYFERRFNLPVRMTASGIYTIGTIFSMAVVLYAPSIILAQDLSIAQCIVIGGAVCLVYTGFGGMKAVVWVDNIQVFIMAVGLVLMAVKGTLDAGGIQHTWELYKAGGRADGLDIDLSPWNRHTVWNLLFFGGWNMASSASAQQMVLQRYMVVKNMRHAQWSLVTGMFLFPTFYIVIIVIAMAAFAEVGGHEPLLSGEITKPGQIFPHYMMKLLGHVPGLTGLLVAAAFAAALSTLSSGQNSLAAVILEDFVRPIYKLSTGRELGAARAGLISRLTGLAMGGLTTCLGLAVMNSNDFVFSLVRTMDSFVTGPLFVLMLCWMFIPFVESWGAMVGMSCALLWGVQMYIGSLVVGTGRLGSDMKPQYLNNFSTEVPILDADVKPTLYDTSYLWYNFLDVCVGVLVATIVSLCILLHRHRVAKRTDPLSAFKDQFPRTDGLMFTVEDLLVGFGIRKEYKAVETTEERSRESDSPKHCLMETEISNVEKL